MKSSFQFIFCHFNYKLFLLLLLLICLSLLSFPFSNLFSFKRSSVFFICGCYLLKIWLPYVFFLFLCILAALECFHCICLSYLPCLYFVFSFLFCLLSLAFSIWTDFKLTSSVLFLLKFLRVFFDALCFKLILSSSFFYLSLLCCNLSCSCWLSKWNVINVCCMLEYFCWIVLLEIFVIRVI